MSNQIQKSDTGMSLAVSSNIPHPVREIVEMLNTEKVGSVASTKVYNTALAGIAKSFADTGFTISGTEKEVKESQNYLVTEVTEYIRKRYPALRLGEIPVAFARGIRKQYGDYMGLSVLSFTNFIDGYVKDEDRKKALAELAKLQSGHEEQLPAWDKVYDMSKSNAMRAVSEVETGKSIFLYGHIVYDFLDALELIEFSVDEKKQFYSDAYTMILNERRAARETEFDKFRRDNLQSLVDIMERNDTEELKRRKETEIIKSRAKCLSLKRYLESILFEEVDLEAVIEGKREEIRQRYEEQSQKWQTKG